MVRLYVPAGTTIVSAPARAFAARIASRSEQSASHAPSLVSAVLVTVKVDPPETLVAVGVNVGVKVGVLVGVDVTVGVLVTVGVNVGVEVEVGVAVVPLG